jgi:carbonic anhydrase
VNASPPRPSPFRPAPGRLAHAPPGSRWPSARADVGASLVVFLVAVPLSLGIALASGAPIMAGLIAAVVGGVVAGLLGGSPLLVTGPAAGMAVVVAELVGRFGWQLTCLMTIGAGLLQIGFGLTRVARFAQAIPPAVVHGMLAGIGLTIALAQIHVVLGGPPQASAIESVAALPGQLAALQPAVVVVGACTIAALLVWPTLPRRVRVVPAALVAVAAGTALATMLPEVPRVDLPGGLLDAITVPSLVGGEQWLGLVGGALTIALLASVESLLSAVAIEKLHHGPRGNPDRMLIGQGAANSLSGFLGGLPVTGVIVRSATNVGAGARTRASSVLHGIWSPPTSGPHASTARCPSTSPRSRACSPSACWKGSCWGSRWPGC